MTLGNTRLGDQPQKLIRDLTLLENEKCVVKASANTLAIPILIDETLIGHVFLGKGHFTIDAIVETPHGAIGRPLVKNLDQPFLMLGETDKVSESLAPATIQDVSNIGYGSIEELLAKANDIFNRSFVGHHSRADFKDGSHVFAFANGPDRWDILVSKGDKVVYTSKEKVYISDDRANSVAVNPANIWVTKKNKTVVIGRNGILVDRSEE